jgi:Tol biopolymer transport system component
VSLAQGSRLGHYEILGPIGAGGMGEVFKARDSKLARDVAVKVLPERLAEDPDALSRFEREARAVAALSHPNILAIHDFGREGSTAYAVMELLEGDTLRRHLSSGGLPTRKAVEYATQIAQALAAAHGKGIVHRDLKPDNIFVTREGRVKLLDFGLAAYRLPGRGGDDSETLSSPTDPGAMLGTVGYMAPEQVRGETADQRSDVFGFGCVLYEMLTGKRAFRRDTAAETLTAILKEDPGEIQGKDGPITPGLDRIVRHCLEKNPEERFQSARDLAFALQAATDGSQQAVGPQLGVHAPSRRLTFGAAALVLAAAGTLTLYQYRQGEQPPEPLKALILPPSGVSFAQAVVSPSGRDLVFIGRGLSESSQLWLRALDVLEARPLPGTEDAAQVFWSPDGRSLGFFSGARLMRLDLSGGPPQQLAEVSGGGRGATWNAGGTIVFARRDAPCFRISAAGGTPEPVTQLDAARGETGHLWPQFLPDGRRFLYFARNTRPQENGLFIGSLDGQTRQFVVHTEHNASYAPPGLLLFVRESIGTATGTLLAQPFDAVAGTLHGNAAPVADEVSLYAGRASFSVSSGTLLYRSGRMGTRYELAWFDRRGSRLGTVAPAAYYERARISPDGRRIALHIDEPPSQGDIHILDLVRNVTTRLTLDPDDDALPVWSPDGQAIVYGSRGKQANGHDLYLKPTSGAGEERLLLASEGFQFPDDWSRDGRFLLYQDQNPTSGSDIWVLPMQGEEKPYPLLATASDEVRGRFAPSGRFVAFHSEETGRDEVFVMPFTGGGRRWQVSDAGGLFPAWRADGRELYYLGLDSRVMVVDVAESGPSLDLGKPRPLFHVPPPGYPVFEAAPDGQRFLVFEPTQEIPVPLVLVTNWRAGLPAN